MVFCLKKIRLSLLRFSKSLKITFSIILITIFLFTLTLYYLYASFSFTSSSASILFGKSQNGLANPKNSKYPLFYETNATSYGWIRSRRNVPCDKWIVSMTKRRRELATVTEELKILNDAIYGWCLLVVADDDDNDDGQTSDDSGFYKDAQFLSLRDQREILDKFGFGRDQLVRGRQKLTAGFLYAISHGARLIFETGDDVSLRDGLFKFRQSNFNGLVAFPVSPGPALFTFSSSSYRQSSVFKIYSKSVAPIVQIGSFALDDTNMPSIVLEPGLYPPSLNSKATMFGYDAFWALFYPNYLIPESDLSDASSYDNVLRTLILARFVALIDRRLAFVPSRIETSDLREQQKNNQQPTIKSSISDNNKQLLAAINGFNCTQNERLSNCIINLVRFLAKEKLINQALVSKYVVWIKALDKAGYKWPSIVAPSLSSFDRFVYFFNKPGDASLTTKKSSGSCSTKKINDLVLVTFASTYSDLNRVISAASRFFAYTIVCFIKKQSVSSSEENVANSQVFDKLSFNSTIAILTDWSSNHAECVSNATRIGFAPNSYVIFPERFDFWAYDFDEIEFDRIVETNSHDLNDFNLGSYQEEAYFARLNVANNGLRRMRLGEKKIEKQSIDSICDLKLSGERLSAALNLHTNDLAGENCAELKIRTVWIPDYHDGPRVDFSSTLVHLGMRPILANPKRGLSPYPRAIELSRITGELSQFILNHVPFERQVHLDTFRENFDFYSRLAEFEQVDAVLCAFTVAVCEAFMSLNKTLIFSPAHRYNIGRCSRERWHKLNENYATALNKSVGIVAAMSRYDLEYQAHFTGLRGYRLYAFGGYYAKHVHYNPIRSEFLVGPTSYLGNHEKQWLVELNQFAAPHQLEFRFVRDVYRRYDLQDLANHPGVVIFPYAAMSYSFVDFYIAQIPIFVPSIEILAKYKTVVDRNVKYGSYCRSDTDDIQPDPNSAHGRLSPNDDENETALKYWLKYADYFQWPFVSVFRSWQELVDMARDRSRLRQISQNMRWFNRLKEADLLENWCQILKKLNKTQLPRSYDESLRYFGFKDFQV